VYADVDPPAAAEDIIIEELAKADPRGPYKAVEADEETQHVEERRGGGADL